MKKEDIYKTILSHLEEFNPGDSLKLTYVIFINFKEDHLIDLEIFTNTLGKVLIFLLKGFLDEELVSFLVSSEDKGVAGTQVPSEK